ncbi:MAG: outer membrane lipoprotein chaperone LolA [Gammaproteobacteria bacterium]|nr:MAG: outer membrane lipoprotein chaperone LolA [Gammaproteobacteria bacterium]
MNKKELIMKRLFTLALVLSSAAAFSDASGPARSELEKFSTGLESLQLDFTQVVKSQDGRIQDTTQGSAWLQSPDKLRWVYTGDFPETIVADGSNVWIYDETLEQVTIKPQSDRVADAPLQILTDISQLDQQFLVAELGEFEDMQLLELKSRESESEFERIMIGLDATGIRMMVMEDAFGQRTEIRFRNIVRNAAVDPQLFSFKPPQGADVVGQVTPTGQP